MGRVVVVPGFYHSDCQQANKSTNSSTSPPFFLHVKTLPVAEGTALIAGDIAATLSFEGRGISPEDLLIAATAVEKGLTLVTANQKHFKGIEGLRTENWLNSAESFQLD